MSALFGLAVLALVVVTAVKLGLRGAVAVRDANARINSDVATLRAFPTNRSGRGSGVASDSASPCPSAGEARPTQ